MQNRKIEKELKTFGEALVERQMNVNNWEYTFDNAPDIEPHKERMPRGEAAVYYTKKINEEFERLGYVKIGERPQDFDTIEDYYDYHEAKKIKIEMIKNGKI